MALRAVDHQLPGTLASTRTTLGDLTTLRPTARADRDGADPHRQAAAADAARYPDADPRRRAAAAGTSRRLRQRVLPLAKQLPPIASAAEQAIPPLINSFKVVNYVPTSSPTTRAETTRVSSTGWPGSLITRTRSCPPRTPTARLAQPAPHHLPVAEVLLLRATARDAAGDELRMLMPKETPLDGHPGTQDDRPCSPPLAFTLSCVGLIIFVWTQFGGTIPFGAQGYRIKAAVQGDRPAGPQRRRAHLRGHRRQGDRGAGPGRQLARDPGHRARLTRRCPRTRGRSCARRRCSARPTSSSRPATAPGRSSPTAARSRAPDRGNPAARPGLGSFDTPTQQQPPGAARRDRDALAGRGQDLNDAIGNLDPAVTELTAVVGVLNEQQGNLRR